MPTIPRHAAGIRPAVLLGARLASLSLNTRTAGHDPHDDVEPGSIWILYVASLVLVLLGGAFAGLTIALMGQDGIYLQVVSRDKGEPQHNNARRVYDLLQKGKHWVLVTLLLGNVIVNETLPVVLDRCLGGGVAAVVGSTVLIVIFGEILPQSVCVRYGLQIGGFMAKPVLFLMWAMAPVAWPTAKLLDKVLGEDHGTVYKKSGLKTLVTLHKSLGEASDRLNQDEVTIISAVLDLKGKTVESVMTPMDDVFVMSEDTRLDQDTMDEILSAGYSRIPIHEHGNPTNFIGMLLVKILITYDPEDAKLVRDFQLATLPETRPETSCLDIINFFQEGKSHMVLVSEFPGEDHGAIGVVTLEDVIEELIGEEIIDESDIFIDVHKAIRRLAPAPRAKVKRHPSESKGTINGNNTFASNDPPLVGAEGDAEDAHRRVGSIGANSDVLGTTPKTASFMMRRSSTSNDGSLVKTTIPVRANIREIRQHLRHLGPSNPAINPKGTRSTTVKIKPGIQASNSNPQRPDPKATEIVAEIPADGDEATPLIRPQLSSKDGIHALRQSYGSVNPSASRSKSGERDAGDAEEDGNQGLLIEIEGDTKEDIDRAAAAFTNDGQGDESSDTPEATNSRSVGALASRGIWRTGSGSQQGSDHSSDTQTPKRHNVRSGSITENIVETRGVRKVVLETTSSNDDDENGTLVLPPSPRDARLRNQTSIAEDTGEGGDEDDGTAEGSVNGTSNGQATRRKNRRKKRRGGS